MIELSNGALNLLRRRTARLCHVWSIERQDGREPLHLTVHDQMLNRFDGLSFNPRPGLSMSANRRAAGIGEKSIEITGPIGDDGGVTYADLHQGRMWGAIIHQRMVDWSYDFGPEMMFNEWNIADIEYDDRSWTFQLTGLSTRLKGKRGDVFSRLCQNELGVQNALSSTNIVTTSACPVNISNYPFRVQGAVIIDSTTGFGQDPTKTVIYVKKQGSSAAFPGFTNTAHLDGNFSSQFFSHGRVIIQSGALAGLQENIYGEVDVGFDSRSAGVRAFRLMRPLPDLPAVGDTLDVYVGCDKQWATCRDKFGVLQGNISTFPGTSGGFRGFPDIPGTDRATTYPPARGQ